ncbi:MAG: sigma 54-interacting transcriptional regulator [Kofleriaceae bacterium]|nr:sigma 54-interacting transcriptional regulator [Kofleriaceae bacterium]
MPITLPLNRDSSDEAQLLSAQFLYLSFESSRPLAQSVRHSLVGVDEVHIGRGEKRRWSRTTSGGKVVLHIEVADSWMSTAHLRLSCRPDRVLLHDLGSRNGTLVNGEEKQSCVLADKDVIEVGCTFFVFSNDTVELDHQPDLDGCELVGEPGMTTLLPELRRQMEQLEKIAKSQRTVIVHGESGTGKELVARAIHVISGRTGSFVAVNCAAIPDSLLESEFFGHRKGAFSGATSNRTGRIEGADGGTLFLDEVIELSAKAQAALLRVLQEQEVLPIGASTPVSIDLRVLVASHQDLAAAVEQGRFREDLYARLSAFTVTLLPLRERSAELGSILAAILQNSQRADMSSLTIEPDAARALLLYRWPRNIRELEKHLVSALVLAEGSAIGLSHLRLPNPRIAEEVLSEERAQSELSASDTILRARLLELLVSESGNVTHVAKALSKSRQQVQRWCKRFEIDLKQYR